MFNKKLLQKIIEQNEKIIDLQETINKMLFDRIIPIGMSIEKKIDINYAAYEMQIDTLNLAEEGKKLIEIRKILN